jgi:hypothetical protein
VSRPDDDDDDVPRERLILVDVIEAFPSLHTFPLPPKPRAPKKNVVVVIAKKVAPARFFSSSSSSVL